MKKIHFRKYLLNIALLFVATLLTTVLWYAALEKAYAHVLVFSSNTVLSIGGRDSHITLEEEDGVATFRAHAIINTITVLKQKHNSFEFLGSGTLRGSIIIMDYTVTSTEGGNDCLYRLRAEMTLVE